MEIIEKNPIERIQVELKEYRKKQYLDIRTYYRSDDGDWKPTKKGVTIPPDCMEDLLQAVIKINEEYINSN